MLKSHPGLTPPDDAETPDPVTDRPDTGESATGAGGETVPAAAHADESPPAIFTGPFVPVRPRNRSDRWESPARRAHRLRMKKLFARGFPAV